MSAIVRTGEPEIIRAGDTLTWSKSIPDYPASTYTLKYRLIKASTALAITASADGTDYLVSVAASVTAAYAAGDYQWTSWVETSTERYTIGSGRMTVLPNPAVVAAYDTRGSARSIYEKLLAAYHEKIDSEQGYVQEYDIAGRRMRFTSSADWLKEISFWKSEAAKEEKAERLAAGLGGNKNRILVRL